MNRTENNNNTAREREGERGEREREVSSNNQISPNTMSWYEHSIANLHHDNSPEYLLSPRTQTLDSKTGVLQGGYIMYV